jgi:PBP1b-binding outer membrane lipoprotein LpoB
LTVRLTRIAVIAASALLLAGCVSFGEFTANLLFN